MESLLAGYSRTVVPHVVRTSIFISESERVQKLKMDWPYCWSRAYKVIVYDLSLDNLSRGIDYNNFYCEQWWWKYSSREQLKWVKNLSRTLMKLGMRHPNEIHSSRRSCPEILSSQFKQGFQIIVLSSVRSIVDIREFKIRRLRTTNYGWTSVVLCS